MGSNENEYYKIVQCPHCGQVVTDIVGINDICTYCGKLLNAEQVETENSFEPDEADASERNTITNGKLPFFTRKILAWTSSLLLVLSIILSVGLFNSTNTNKTLQNDLFDKSSDFDDIQNEHSELQDKHDKLNSDHKSLLIQHSDIKKEIENYKDQQATIDDLNAKLVGLQKQYTTLETDRNGILVQLDAKKAEQERVAQERAVAQQAAQAEASGTGTVFWVPGGSVYHSTSSCSTLSRSSGVQSGSIASSGKNRGCKVCH